VVGDDCPNIGYQKRLTQTIKRRAKAAAEGPLNNCSEYVCNMRMENSFSLILWHGLLPQSADKT
jgi:hypothetical protein